MSDQRTYRRVVVKLGTNVLTAEDGSLDLTVIDQIVDQVTELKKRGIQVILVSSGAVGAGKASYTLTNVQDAVIQRQVYSAIGQLKLLNLYAQRFEERGLVCAQVLATKEDFQGKEHYKNMKNCFKGLLKDDIIPIVNENDVVSLTELMFTDNDELAGLTAFMINAEALFILTSVEGLFTGKPGAKGSELIPFVDFGNQQVDDYIDPDKSSQGRGGMQSKLEVARVMTSKGITAYICNGKQPNVLPRIMDGESIGTKFEIAVENSTK